VKVGLHSWDDRSRREPARPSLATATRVRAGRGRQAAAAKPDRQWPRSAIMPDDPWVSVAIYSERVSAQAILAILAGEGFPCYIASDEHVPGLGSAFAVRVPTDLLARARSLVEHGDVSDSELHDLAMRGPPEGSTGT
jgi:hypothetical protein